MKPASSLTGANPNPSVVTDFSALAVDQAHIRNRSRRPHGTPQAASSEDRLTRLQNPATISNDSKKRKNGGASLAHRQAGDPLKLDELEDRRRACHQVFLRELQRLRGHKVVRVAEAHAVPVEVELDRQRSRVCFRVGEGKGVGIA